MEPQRIEPKIVPTSMASKLKSTPPPLKQIPNGSNNNTEQNKPKKPKGLLSFAIILLILLIGASGFAYWRYDKDKKEKEALSSAKSTVEQDLKKAKEDLENSDKADSTDSYILIKEWNINYKNDSTLGQIVYSYNTTNNVAYLSSTTLMTAHLNAYEKDTASPKKDQIDQCSPQSGPLGAVVRGKAGEKYNFGETGSNTTYDQVSGAKKVGEYFYIYTQPQAACSSYESVSKLATEQQTKLKNQFLTSLRIVQ